MVDDAAKGCDEGVCARGQETPVALQRERDPDQSDLQTRQPAVLMHERTRGKRKLDGRERGKFLDWITNVVAARNAAVADDNHRQWIGGDLKAEVVLDQSLHAEERTRVGGDRHAVDRRAAPIARPVPEVERIAATRYAAVMRTMRARVTSGRLRLESPSDLPEGTELDVVLADDAAELPDGLTDAERDILADAHDAALADSRSARAMELAAFVDRLRAQP